MPFSSTKATTTVSERRTNGDSGMFKSLSLYRMAVRFRLSGLFDECGEQSFGKRIFLKSTLGVPLYTDHELSINVFNCFNNSVRRRRNGPEVRADLCNGLVMKTIHLDRLCPRQSRQNAVGAHSYRMPRRLLRFAMVVVKYRLGNDRWN